MKNSKGVIGIVILIIVALAVGAGATYWYVQKDIPEAQGFDVTYTETPKGGDDVPYQAIVQPEPNYKVYSDTVVSFQYPKDWIVVEEHTGLVIQGRFASSTATSTIILSSAGSSFGDTYQRCMTPISINIQGSENTINFMCDTDRKANAINKDTVRVFVDTGHSFAMYGTLSKKDTEDYKAKYIEVFTQIVTTLNFTN